MGHSWQEVLLDDGCGGGGSRHADGGELGASPWDAPHPLVLDTSASRARGYCPAGDYAATVNEEIRWLLDAASGGPEAHLLPGADDPFVAPFFPYETEDRYLHSPPAELRRLGCPARSVRR